MREDCQALKEHIKERRAKRRAQMPLAKAQAILVSEDLCFTVLSPEHIRVWPRGDVKDAYMDYWPSTGRWRSKDGSRHGFNIDRMVKAAKEA
jgi:hypothetical protein